MGIEFSNILYVIYYPNYQNFIAIKVVLCCPQGHNFYKYLLNLLHVLQLKIGSGIRVINQVLLVSSLIWVTLSCRISWAWTYSYPKLSMLLAQFRRLNHIVWSSTPRMKSLWCSSNYLTNIAGVYISWSWLKLRYILALRIEQSPAKLSQTVMEIQSTAIIIMIFNLIRHQHT